MARLAPAACSSRAIAAPTRFAPPVISTVLPVRLVRYPSSMHSMTSAASVTTLPQLNRGGTRARRACRGAHPRVHRVTGRCRSASMPTCAWRCMRRGSATTARAPPSSAVAAISSPRRRSRACFRAAWRARWPTCSRSPGGDVLELGAGLGTMAADVLTRARGARSTAGPLPDSRGQRGPRRAPARAHRAAAGERSPRGWSG